MIIYKITHKKSGRFYIGRTIQKLERRIKQHKQQTKTKNIISSLLRKYKDSEFIYEIVDGIVGDKNEINFDRLINLEQKYININFNNNLCVNLSTSAKGPTFSVYKTRTKFVQSQKEKDKFRQNYLNWWNNRTPEQDLNRREKTRLSHEAKLTPIKMFDTQNNYLETFKSLRSIVRKYTDLDRAAILRVLKGKANQHKGYLFKYITQK